MSATVGRKIMWVHQQVQQDWRAVDGQAVLERFIVLFPMEVVPAIVACCGGYLPNLESFWKTSLDTHSVLFSSSHF